MDLYNPDYYITSKVEAIEVIEAFDLPYHLGNVVKYVLRAGKKDDILQDLKKAKWYLERYIGRLEDDKKRSA